MWTKQWQMALYAVLITVSMVLSVAIYAKRDTVQKMRLRHIELMTHRQNIELFLLTRKHLPQNLAEVSTAPTTDPFGRPYSYDAKTGAVSSKD